ncbi:hypothetical protein FOF44_07115 [Vibrio algivorus]|uniref:Uncharacterized protein n=2 Tax=Vibrio algivorus TaxID=1667024 RepID=A0A557P9W0_9VIBR|nr:hypothetical protein FOF44_07115 [Vibrio algivorus]
MIKAVAGNLGRGDSKGTLDDVAEVLNMNIHQLKNRLYNKKGQDLTCEQLLELTVQSNSSAIAQYFAGAIGQVVVDLPEPDIDTVDMFECQLKLNAVKGLLDMTIEEARKDGVLDAEERQRISKLKMQFQAMFEGFMFGLDSLYAEQK